MVEGKGKGDPSNEEEERRRIDATHPARSKPGELFLSWTRRQATKEEEEEEVKRSGDSLLNKDEVREGKTKDSPSAGPRPT